MLVLEVYLLFVTIFFFLCEEVLALMVVAYKEAALILKVEVGGEAISRNFADNLLF